MKSEDKIPNLFIVGAPKCGTTALYEYLRTHPNIYMCNSKEPHYFSHDFPKRKSLVSSSDEYIKLFQKATDDNLVIGEASTSYLNSSVAIREIYIFNSDAKIIVMLRNPVSMVYSFHSHLFRGFMEDEMDFEKAWRLQESRRNGECIPKHCFNPSLLQYSQIAKFSEQVERLFNIFPRDQVKIILFDDFKTSTKTVYEDVLAFLGVSSDGKAKFPVVNQTKVLKFRLLNDIVYYGRYLIPLKEKFGIEKGIIIPKIEALNTKKEHLKPLSPSFRSELINEFKDDVEKLSKLLNRDLSHWLK